MKRQRFLAVPASIWAETCQGLRNRSNGSRESACVWVGKRFPDRENVEAVHFLDDLPEVRRQRFSHRTSREATNLLFEKLRAAGHVIVADIHTHPEDWVGLSPTDAAHPIEYRKGLIAIVLPHFAVGLTSFDGLGVHEYGGEGRWSQLTPREIARLIKIE